MRRSLFVCMLLFVAAKAFSQSDILKVADDHVEKGNYLAALKIYQRVADKDTLNGHANFGSGYCILYSAMDKKQSVRYLERAVRAGYKNDDLMFFLARAYHQNLMFEMAEAAFREYKTAEKGQFLAEVPHYLEYVQNAKKIATAPISVDFTNLGPNINSEFPDYYPMITPDESFIAFTSRRKKNVSARLEFDGFYSSDIWMSRVQDGNFAPAENIGRAVNSGFDEQLVGLSVNADQMFVYSDNVKEYGNIYYSTFANDYYNRKIRFDDAVNSEHFESAATISADESTLFFSSDRPGGFGLRDLYMTRKLPNGQWAIPQNLGPKINTPYNEDFPYLFFDGQSLYFASEGHNSIGGYDIFKSTWNPENNTWTKPVNVGFPVNTPDDNMTISFNESQHDAYISCWRKDSHGDLDIYKVSFMDRDPRQTVITGKIKKKDTELVIKQAFVAVIDNSTQDEIGTYAPNPNTGSLVIALQPGSYHIIVDVEGYQTLETDMVIKGKSDFKEVQLHDFVVTPN